MNAFVEIIETLIESISGETWLECSCFPFRNLLVPKGKVYDVCFFEVSAEGAVGFLWIEFDGISDLYIMPFRLSRYSEIADLISMPPWSLREASGDEGFYELWVSSQRIKNPLLTANNGTFLHKQNQGEPSISAFSICSDTKNICVRVDFQVAYKLFRVIEIDHPQSIEVEVLTYLGNQNIFANFAKLVSVFELSSRKIKKAHIAISLRYIQNDGVLFPHFVSLLHQSLFPKNLKERAAKKAWDKILTLTESVGRLLGDFHRAMIFAPRNSELNPVYASDEFKQKWLDLVSVKIVERMRKVLSLQKNLPIYSGVFYLLPDYIEELLEKLKLTKSLGLLIRTHGNFNLNQMLLGKNSIVLLDYETDSFEDLQFRRHKQPCLEDIASFLASLRFAWFYTEKKYYSTLVNDSDSKENNNINNIKKSKINHKVEDLEDIFFKFYNSSLDESAGTSQLRPEQKDANQALLNFSLLMVVLKEIIRNFHLGNPSFKIWFQVLQHFMMQTSVKQPY